MDAVTFGVLGRRFKSKHLPRVRAATMDARAGTGNVKILILGDSMAYRKLANGWDSFRAAYGPRVGALNSFPDSLGITTTSVSGGVATSTGEYDVWPTGEARSFPSGEHLAIGLDNALTDFDQVKVYYLKEPGAGTFKLTVDSVDQATYDCAAASVSVGVATVNRTPTGTAADVRIEGVTGTCRTVGHYLRLGDGGMEIASIYYGGLHLTDAVDATALANFEMVISDFDPDLITYEAKEETGYEAARETFFDSVDNAAPDADVLLIGSQPTSAPAERQIQENANLQTIAARRGYVYWSAYDLVGSYDRLTALGWEGDGTHATSEFHAYAVDRMATDTGLFPPKQESLVTTTVSAAGTVTIDTTDSLRQRIDTAGNDITLALDGAPAGGDILYLSLVGTGTVTFPDGEAPTPPSSASGSNNFVFMYDDVNRLWREMSRTLHTE